MLEELEKVKGEFTESQKINFCKSLTFLELGMTFKDESGKELNDDKKDALIAGILANWCEEGFFSETNAENSKGYSGIDNSDDYEYETDKYVGFGIMQWTYPSRKKALIDRAVEMDSGVGNINTQFAMVRYETEEDRTESRKWYYAISQVEEDVKGVDLARKFASKYLLFVEVGDPASEKKEQRMQKLYTKDWLADTSL